MDGDARGFTYGIQAGDDDFRIIANLLVTT
jgi:hypothetical protein